LNRERSSKEPGALIRVVILGGAGGATMAAQTIQSLSHARGSHQLVGYLNDRLEIGTPLYGSSVLGRFEDWESFDEDVQFIAPVHKPGHMQANARRINGLKIPVARWASLIDPLANVAGDALLGTGSAIAPFAQVGPGCSIGQHCVIRSGAVISHDIAISDSVYVAGNCVVGGYSRIETGAHIASGAIIRDELTVGRFALVGLGAVVTQSVPAFAVVYGAPARIRDSIKPIDETA